MPYLNPFMVNETIVPIFHENEKRTTMSLLLSELDVKT